MSAKNAGKVGGAALSCWTRLGHWTAEGVKAGPSRRTCPTRGSAAAAVKTAASQQEVLLLSPPDVSIISSLSAHYCYQLIISSLVCYQLIFKPMLVFLLLLLFQATEARSVHPWTCPPSRLRPQHYI